MVVVAATPNYLRQASQNLGKYSRVAVCIWPMPTVTGGFSPSHEAAHVLPKCPSYKRGDICACTCLHPPTARAAAGATEDCRMHARADVGGSPRREGVVLTRTGYYLGRVDAASSGVFIYRHVRAELLKHVLVSPLGINV